MKKYWVINFGVNKSHKTESFSDQNGNKLFDKKKDALKHWGNINFEEYKAKGFGYFSLEALHFGVGAFSCCEKNTLVKENILL